jgi:hypothetical protein
MMNKFLLTPDLREESIYAQGGDGMTCHKRHGIKPMRLPA